MGIEAQQIEREIAEETHGQARARRSAELAAAVARVRRDPNCPDDASDEDVERWATSLLLTESQALQAPPNRPSVHVGEVLGVLYGELTQLIREHQALKAFEGRVVEAAKSPAAWLQLRQELAK
jgi:hypothetical protein